MRARIVRGAVAAVAAAGLMAGLSGCAEDLGVPPGMRNAEAIDVTSDGVALVHAWPERLDLPVRSYTSWLHTPDGTWTEIEGLVGRAIADDGTVAGVTGDLTTRYQRAAVWHADRGVQLVGPMPDDRYSRARGLSESGLAVGESWGIAAPDRGFLWDTATGVVTLLAPAGADTASGAAAVNDAGTVVGWSRGDRQRAVVWEAPDYQPRVLDTSEAASYPSGVDDDGTVVGTAWDDATGVSGRRWGPDGSVSDLGPGFIPTAIDDGTMVGNREDQPGGALVWPAGADAPQELGTVPGSTARAREIAGDHIVGWLEGPDGRHAARFTTPPP